MHLDVDVRFYGDNYNQIGRGHAEVRCDHGDDPYAVIDQLTAAIQPMIDGLVKHARSEAILGLADLRNKEKEKAQP